MKTNVMITTSTMDLSKGRKVKSKYGEDTKDMTQEILNYFKAFGMGSCGNKHGSKKKLLMGEAVYLDLRKKYNE